MSALTDALEQIISGDQPFPVSYTHLDVYKRQVLEQYDETLSALDELEVAWQQQTLVQEIIALRQQLSLIHI